MEAFLDCEWDSLCKLFTVDESPDLFANNNTILHNVDHNNSYYSSLSEWISNPPNNFLETTSHANNSDSCADVSSASNDILSCIDFSAVNGEIDGSLRLTDTTTFANDGNIIDSVNMSSPNTELSLKRKLETPKKNARVSKTTPKSNKKAKQKPEQETTSNSEDSNRCISEEINEAEDSTSNITVSTTSTGKKRASRGAATDPQSLYARKRRMKINERLRILQNLVPNGTKVDISTMLEEAFHYVKFMQLQIRLLSSDELWMYAPLAYNGLDVGAYGRMPSFPGL